MTPFESFVEKAAAPGPERIIPGCVLLAADHRDVFYEKCVGTQSLDPKSPLVNTPPATDTTMWIASCTKLMTAICALQCVEKGLLSLDGDVGPVLPEYAHPEILTGFEEGSGKPLYAKAKNKITLRMLLTHTAGLAYDFMSEDITRLKAYMKKQPRDKNTNSFTRRFYQPIAFEPGTSWVYGIGTDWAGKMVERVNGGMPLREYMRTHIWEPLGLQQTAFQPDQRPDILAKRPDMSMRRPDGTLAPSPTRYYPDNMADDSGGGGVFSSPRDYIKLLSALLLNDGRLLSPASMDVLFAPCLSPAAEKGMYQNLYGTYAGNENGEQNYVYGALPEEAAPSYAPGGITVRRNVTGRDGVPRRRKGALAWGGVPNLKWVVDREANVALFLGAQLLPSGDQLMAMVFERFEEAIYSGELVAGRPKI